MLNAYKALQPQPCYVEVVCQVTESERHMSCAPVRAARRVVVPLEVRAQRRSVVVRLLVHEDDVAVIHRIQLQVGRPSARSHP